MRWFTRAAFAAAGIAIGFWRPLPLDAATGRDRKAPSIALKTLDGKSVKLDALKGRVVVVDFWSSWCAPCKATFPALNALAAELAEQGVDVLAVSEDERRKDLDGFVAGIDLRLRVLIDPHGDAAGGFRVGALPSLFVVDREGVIRFSHPNYAADVVDAVRAEIATLTSPRNPSAASPD